MRSATLAAPGATRASERMAALATESPARVPTAGEATLPSKPQLTRSALQTCCSMLVIWSFCTIRTVLRKPAFTRDLNRELSHYGDLEMSPLRVVHHDYSKTLNLKNLLNTIDLKHKRSSTGRLPSTKKGREGIQTNNALKLAIHVNFNSQIYNLRNSVVFQMQLLTDFKNFFLLLLVTPEKYPFCLFSQS